MTATATAAQLPGLVRLRILGVDLSLTSTGVAGDGWTNRLQPGRLRGEARLDWIRDQVLDLCRPEPPHLVVLEGFVSRSPAAALLGGVHAIVRWSLWRRQIPFVAVPPANLKQYATGRGRADKDQVIAAAFKRLPGFDGQGNDEADAAWLRAMALDRYGLPVCPLPQTHRLALRAVQWPDLGGVL